MANDHYQFNPHDQHRSGGGGGDDDDDIVSLLKKYYASSIPVPPVPHADPRLLQTPQKPSIPVLDPQTMPAKQGLNNWGVFTGRGNCATKSGLFGLGPLLFRHGRGNYSKEASTPPTPPSSLLTGQDLVEMDRLQRNDPDSFNPMRAVWWVKFDDDDEDENDDVVEDGEASPVQRERESKEQETENAESLWNDDDGFKYQQSMSGAAMDGLPRQRSRDDDVAFDKSTVTHSGGVPVYTPTLGDVHQSYSQDTRFVPAPTKNEGTTSSNAIVAGPDGRSLFVPPVAVSYSNPRPRVDSIPPHRRQQHEHHHDHEIPCGLSLTEPYEMIHEPSYMPSDVPSTMPSFSFSIQPDHTQHDQLAYSNYSTTNSSSSSILQPAPLPLPQQQENDNLVLCLAPSCKARFSTEAQLWLHFQAVHASSNQSDEDGLHQSYTPPSISLACSWNSCRARGFTSDNALMWHVKAEHLLQCPLPACCDRMFRSKKQAEEHARKRLSCL